METGGQVAIIPVLACNQKGKSQESGKHINIDCIKEIHHSYLPPWILLDRQHQRFLYTTHRMGAGGGQVAVLLVLACTVIRQQSEGKVPRERKTYQQ
jgi:hypothetical protein